MVRALYCKDVDGTIISPTTVIQQNQYLYYDFDIDCEKGEGILILKHRDDSSNLTFGMTIENGLWFHNYDPTSPATA